ncbi:NAD(P)H-dependent oxidoreductase [Kribbella qitaiheensis]|uniref:NAD(P)H-dependent oxidoreductase n=1 Tax=Kribbella qitaiheensis TaxID=1544730 RepID=A0A7G6X8M4_9ACTN|nr:NAD(P)H-dependent oxidoreductase [Kribbella qitaiheensis]QNE22589.1 NAD(P)H-dependent oxidoreductase [Kribbella qitaiheensis]
MKVRLVVIVGSTRTGRFGPTVADWFAQQAAKWADLDVDVIDLATADLPPTLTGTDEPTPATVAVLAPRLAAADAFAVVTPEYNCSFPAPLKTALDWYYDEWHAKPVALVAYGRESGGLHAVAQLRQVFTELHAVTIRNTVTLPCYWKQFAADGSWPRPGSGYDAAAKLLLDQLVWWAQALRDARTKHPYQA